MPNTPATRCLTLALIALGLLGIGGCVSAPPALIHAHSHNDYERPRPLFDALELGFTSIEVDIHLVDGQLLVAHDADEVQPGRSLETLYLAPLRAWIEKRGGWAFEDQTPLWLLVDIKTAGPATYMALHEQLAEYRDIIASFGAWGRADKPVRVVISGNRPAQLMREQPVRYAGYDGRLKDLQSQVSTDFMPLISDNWNNHFEWRGEGEFPQDQRRTLDRIVERCHAYGRRIRFWATPDDPRMWAVLHEAGVDLIGTDHPKRLHDFLVARQPKQ